MPIGALHKPHRLSASDFVRLHVFLPGFRVRPLQRFLAGQRFDDGTRFACGTTVTSEMPSNRTPQFLVGDQVRIVIPGLDKGKRGMIIQLINHAGDFVYRYEVRFGDGTTKRYFGFEIGLVSQHST